MPVTACPAQANQHSLWLGCREDINVWLEIMSKNRVQALKPLHVLHFQWETDVENVFWDHLPLLPVTACRCHYPTTRCMYKWINEWGREWMNAESPVRARRLLTLSLSAHNVRGNVLGRRLWSSFFIAAAGQTYLLTISKWSCHMSTIWNAPHMLKWHMNQMHGAAHQSTTFIYMAWSPILMYAQLKQLNLGHGNALLSSALSTCMVLGRSSGQDCHSHSCMTDSWTGLDCFVQQHVAMNETLCCLTYFSLIELKILLFRSWCHDKNL